MQPNDPAIQVAWVLPRARLEDRSVQRVLLLPAWEFAVGVRVRADDALDPFERAVMGASRTGTTDPEEQARALGLDPEFVRHIHKRLAIAGRLTSRGRPPSSRVHGEHHQAISMFADPGGSWWPRHVPHTQVCRPVKTSLGRPALSAGTDGDPYEVAIRTLGRSHGQPPAFDVEAAQNAILAWNRELDRRGDKGERVTGTSLRNILEPIPVHLVAPVDRGASRPVLDPFGGPTWRPMLVSLAEAQSRDPGLARWLRGSVDQPGGATALHFPDSTADRARTLLLSSAASGSARAAQLGLDLLDAAHGLLDHLIEAAPSSPALQCLDGYVANAALSFGLTTGALKVAPDPAGSRLRDRLVALMTCYSPQVPGPVHEAARALPTLLHDLCQLEDDRDLPVDEVRNVVQALLDTTTHRAGDN